MPQFRLLLSMIVLALLLVSDKISHAQEVPSTGQLTWKNGDKVPGEIVSADASRLKWRAANLFRDPLNLELGYLDQISFAQKNAATKTTETYSIQMIDGFSLFGAITSLDDQFLTVSSSRFGEVQVDRKRIATILNLKNSGSVLNGEINLANWGSDRGEKKYWTVNDQGQLQSQRNNIHIYFKSELPDSCLIEVELQWSKKLDFTFGFGVPRNTRSTESLPRLESWDDSIVLSHNDDFDIVSESQDAEAKRLKLLIHWDRLKNQIVIHSEQGKQLAQADLGAPSRSVEPGIFIENKSGDLTVATLMIRKSSAGFDATKPSVQTNEQAAINGWIQSFDGSVWSIVTDDESVGGAGSENSPDGIMPVPIDQFCGAFLINKALPRPQGMTRLKYFDGMYVGGDFVSINDGLVSIQSTFSSEPIALQIAGAVKLSFGAELPASEAETFSHKLFNEAGEIQGRLESGSGSADDILRWRVAGAESSVPFSRGNSRIVIQPEKSIADVDDDWTDTLYLTNRDTIPCRVVGIDEQHVTVDSFTENKRIDGSLIKAIDMRNEIQSEGVGTTDAQWVISEAEKKLVNVGDDKFKLKAGANFGHPSLFSSGSFEFELRWPGSYGLLECNLLASDVVAGEGGKKISIMMYDKGLYIGEAGNLNRGGMNGQQMIQTSGKTKIAFKFEKGELLVLVNGRNAFTTAVPSDRFLGRGVVFELSDLYQQGITCDLSDFKRDFSGFAGNTFVDPGRRELLLTIPRLMKNRPPKQVLGATNGDLLRGELVSLDAERVVFRSNNDDKTFPRTVVSSIVWLHAEDLTSEVKESDEVEHKGESQAGKPDVHGTDAAAKTTEASAGKQTVQILMQGGRRMTSTLQAWSDGKLSGQSPALGVVHVPFGQIQELRFGSYATEAMDVPYADWVAKLAPAPKLETGADGNAGSDMLFGSSSPLIGATPKTFTAKMLDGSTFNLKDQHGKVVVLDFWATWCGPCVQALPGMTRVISNYSPDQVTFVAVNQEEAINTINEFMTSRELDFPVALDDGKLSQQFSVEAIPQTVIIDRDGKIAFVNVGNSANLDEKLAAAIDHLLNPVATEAAEEK